MKRSFLALTVALLASASVLEGVALAQKADACWFIRLPQAERPECCDLVGKTRFTLPGGDCCKLFLLDATDLGAITDVESSVSQALFAELPRWVVTDLAPREVTVANARARAPPLWKPTDTVRLLI